MVKRKNSNRLQGYDYSLPGAYFVTLVAKNRVRIFGEIRDEKVFLNAAGAIAKEEWLKTEKLRKEVRLDEFMVMPNHLHAILFIDVIDSGQQDLTSEAVGAHRRAPLHRKPVSLGAIVAGYKAATTIKINRLLRQTGNSIWQRNYYDRIIQDQIDLIRFVSTFISIH